MGGPPSATAFPWRCQSADPEIPKTPKMPQIPKMPKIRKKPKIPKLPQIRKASKTSKTLKTTQKFQRKLGHSRKLTEKYHVENIQSSNTSSSKSAT